MARQFKWLKSLLLALVAIFFGVSGQSLPEVEGKLKFSEPNSWKSIQSEDGDVIDCVDIYKQPAFQHPLLTNHKIQMMPSYSPKTEITWEGESSSKHIVTSQLWQKSGSCPKGTIPIRRVQKKDQLHSPSMKEYWRKKLPRFSQLFKHLDDDDDYSYLTSQENQSLAVLQVEASSYLGAQGAIKVCNPFVESDDDYSSSQVALESGSTDYERIESGWAVNPSLYGDKQTRLFTYWTIDSGVYFEILRAKTHYVRITLSNYHSANSSNISSGCFDLTCSGFVQTNSETALGAALYPISVPGRTPHDIHIRIFKLRDLDTGNWWVIFQEKISLGYWPANLFTLLKNQAGLVFWGGEVNSPNVRDHHPHTATEMGCGYLPPPRTDYENVVDYMSGYVRRIGILKDFDTGFVFPYTIGSYTDEHYCYSFVQFEDGSDEDDRPFYYGGHGRSDKCP